MWGSKGVRSKNSNRLSPIECKIFFEKLYSIATISNWIRMLFSFVSFVRKGRIIPLAINSTVLELKCPCRLNLTVRARIMNAGELNDPAVLNVATSHVGGLHSVLNSNNGSKSPQVGS